MNESFKVENDFDEETVTLLKDNEKIVSASLKLSPEDRKQKVEVLYHKILEIIAKTDQHNGNMVFESDDGEESQLEDNVSTKTDERDCFNLKEVRKSLGLNQVDMAKKLGVSQGLVSQVESGRIPASSSLILKAKELMSS